MFRDLFSFIKGFRNKLVIAVITGTIGFLSATLIIIGALIALLNLYDPSVILDFKSGLIISIASAFIRAFSKYFEQHNNHDIAFKVLFHIRNKVFKTLRKLAFSKLDSKNKGEVINTITADIELLEVFYAHTITPIFIAIVSAIIYLSILAYFHIYFALVALAFYLIATVLIPLITYKKLEKLSMDQRNENAKLNSLMINLIDTRYEILQYRKRDEFINKLKEKNEKLYNIQKKMNIGNILNIAASVIIVIGSFYSSYLVGNILYAKNIITLANLIIPTIFIMSSFGPFLAILNLSGIIGLTFSSAKRVFKLMKEEPEVEDVENGKDFIFKDLKVQDISFSYKDRLILDKVSLNLKEGEILGIKGPSGKGKSTLLKLLMRYYDISDGLISYNNISIKDINTNSLRENQSLFKQDSFFFSQSISDNLKIAKIDASKEEIEEVCKACNIDEVIKNLEKTYDSKLNYADVSLSSGEKQRLALARALLSDAKILLLDEPTSNIDALSEAIILETLKKQKDRSIIMVSHRDSSLSICDRILQL